MIGVQGNSLRSWLDLRYRKVSRDLGHGKRGASPLDRGTLAAFLLWGSLLQSCSERWPAKSLEVSDFLGPPPGRTYVLKNSDGDEFEIDTGWSNQRTGALEIGFRPLRKDVEPLQAQSVLRYAERGRLIQEMAIGGEVLLQEPIVPHSSSWTTPFLLSRTEEGYLVDGHCEIFEVERRETLGQERTHVTVECARPLGDTGPIPDVGPQVVLRRVIARDLGVVEESLYETRENNGRQRIFWQRLESKEENYRLEDEIGESGSTPSRGLNETLLDAAWNGDLSRLLKALENGANVNTRGPDDVSLLMIAASRGEVELIKVLLRRGADVNARAKNGGTALIIAVIQNNEEAVALLLEAGAETDQRVYLEGRNGETALMIARTSGNTKLIQMLEEAQRY